MKWIARVILAALAWAVVIGLGVYVHPGWYGLAPLAILATWTPDGDYTPEELRRQAAEDAERRRRQEASPEYRAERLEVAYEEALYRRSQTGDVEAMKAYLDHQEHRARRPRPDWTPTDIMLGNG